ncbi:unnamed protein product [Adineta ricciae]|uniref:Uncharacterized protein n=1 Tax=Adineta ricciae TaxID=249248 RepID=A0A815I665_ADIRI|nr:unnamed protein product [Adineta ricciae]
MKTINDIIFDNFIYRLARFWFFILYDMTGAHLAISLPHAHLMSFIHPFSRTIECKDQIETNLDKRITLFTYEDNIYWLIENFYFQNRPQLQKILIFCSSNEEQDYWTKWTERYRHKIQEPFLHNELDINLLLFGLKHIKTVQKQFFNDHGILNRIQEDKRLIKHALANYFHQRVIEEDDKTKQSEEAQS